MSNILIAAIDYLFANFSTFLQLLREHVFLVFVAEAAAIAVAVPLGILSTRNETLKRYGLQIANVFHTIPPLAVIALVFPIVGIGIRAGFVALWVYGLLPILINTITGIEEVEEDTVRAARGMGMTENQILRKVQLPLAVPVIFAGIRTSTVINVGNAYLAFFIGAGGLGDWVISGIALFNNPQILAGAIPGALLAISLDVSLSRIENRLGDTSEVGQQTSEAPT
ncbi:ABC transporter permease [Halobellus sp. Atlit-38R]|uniref:ABC transporter permease n=1 Tax=Halobellus sp. Atlit-38R TaxID=2282131 RepID=UPI000EF21C40|nr:ABC transporter permease [Halobellus sp. Atlit-38R]RLM89356.1 ABC transporter permease [Halobellus sp. Atlit-38R]